MVTRINISNLCILFILEESLLFSRLAKGKLYSLSLNNYCQNCASLVCLLSIKKATNRRGYRKKNEPPYNFPVSRFYPIFPDFLQPSPDFSPTKIFKVRKCERCGSLNPRLPLVTSLGLYYHQNIRYLITIFLIIRRSLFAISFSVCIY